MKWWNVELELKRKLKMKSRKWPTFFPQFVFMPFCIPGVFRGFSIYDNDLCFYAHVRTNKSRMDDKLLLSCETRTKTGNGKRDKEIDLLDLSLLIFS